MLCCSRLVQLTTVCAKLKHSTLGACFGIFRFKNERSKNCSSFRSNATNAFAVDDQKLIKYFFHLKKLNDEFVKSKHKGENRQAWPALLLEELGGRGKSAMEKLFNISVVVETLNERLHDLGEIEKLSKEFKSDEEMFKETEIERRSLEDEISEIKTSIVESLVTDKDSEDNDGAVLEVTPGIGGVEAAMFATEIFDMYQKFCHRSGYDLDVVEYDMGENGALVKANAVVSSGDGYAYSLFKHEAGIHRVQRVPKTEKSGRLHTSTVSVAVLPKSNEILPPLQRKDLKITFSKSSGHGGQHANSTLSCAVVCHIPTGNIVRVEETRCQKTNLDRAQQKLTHIVHSEAMKAKQAQVNSVRRKQTRSRERSDKIRTYNFHHSRITDHRIGVTLSGIEEFLNGGAVFEKLLYKLEENSLSEERAAVIQALIDEANL
nr:peptide chain release factor 1-like, mitochondrial [Ciona intestinalis]|eukprot:XP_009859731.2 peptide chain release factor 1-like, mitochondrial [Ciona intestinalis]